MLLVSLIFAGIVMIGLYLYRQMNRAATTNHYRKTRTAPALSSTASRDESHHDELLAEEHDALGLSTSKKNTESTASVSKSTTPRSNCVVVIYLMAPDNAPYVGYELLQALLSTGMRYGKQRIFHRHEQKDGRGDILFHCASATAPGTFDLTKMGTFSCTGLCLFFEAHDVVDPLATLDCLLETVDQLIEDIGGTVLDEKRERFTKERMIRYRQQLRTVENSKVTTDMFA